MLHPLEEEPARDKLLAFSASQPYYRCAPLIGLDVARLERQADELAYDAGWALVSVGRRLSLALRSTPPGQRPRTAQQSLQQVLSHAESGPLVCTNVYLLFELTLHLDPLALFREASRSIALAVTWPGCYDGEERVSRLGARKAMLVDLCPAATIVNVARRLPERVLQEDPDLLMYYDNASLRTE